MWIHRLWMGEPLPNQVCEGAEVVRKVVEYMRNKESAFLFSETQPCAGGLKGPHP